MNDYQFSETLHILEGQGSENVINKPNGGNSKETTIHIQLQW